MSTDPLASLPPVSGVVGDRWYGDLGSLTRRVVLRQPRIRRWFTWEFAGVIVQALLSIECFAWFVQLATPPSTFEASRAYAGMAERMSEGHWSMCFGIVWVISMAAIVLRKRRSTWGTRAVKAASAGLVGAIMLDVAHLTWDASPNTMGWEQNAIFAGLSIWVMLVRAVEP